MHHRTREGDGAWRGRGTAAAADARALDGARTSASGGGNGEEAGGR